MIEADVYPVLRVRDQLNGAGLSRKAHLLNQERLRVARHHALGNRLQIRTSYSVPISAIWNDSRDFISSAVSGRVSPAMIGFGRRGSVSGTSGS